MVSRRAIVMAVVPLVSLATFAFGIRVGAQSGVHAASIIVTPRAKGASGAVMTVRTYWDESGVRETVPMKNLTVTAIAQKGAQGSWTGESNEDGIAEVPIAPFDVAPGERVTLDVRTASEPAPLAEGEIAWPAPWSATPTTGASLQPDAREGDIAIDVAIPDGRLTVEEPTRILVHALDTKARGARATITVEPEPGLDAHVVKPCEKGDFTIAEGTALFHVTGLRVRATSAAGHTGTWFGQLPTASGAPRVEVPWAVASGAEGTVRIRGANAREGVYVEIDDANGRAYATWAPFRTTSDGRDPGATVELPQLAPGVVWLVTSGDPRGAATLSGSAVARPMFVASSLPAPDACSVAAKLGPPSAPFARSESLDGLTSRRAHDGGKRHLGFFLALASLFLAGAIEALCVMAGARETRQAMEALERQLDEEDAATESERAESEGEDEKEDDDEKREKPKPSQKPTKKAGSVGLAKKTSAGSVAIGVLAALLGFALLASFLLWRG